MLAINRFVSKELLVRKFLAAIAEGRQVTESQWRALNLWWIGVYFAIGAANLAFAYYTSQAVWAKFKVFGVTGLLLAFLIAQTVWLQQRPEAPAERP